MRSVAKFIVPIVVMPLLPVSCLQNKTNENKKNIFLEEALKKNLILNLILKYTLILRNQ